jgi:prepilin-type N-terminal cleavage/methylation domain-containing protein
MDANRSLFNFQTKCVNQNTGDDVISDMAPKLIVCHSTNHHVCVSQSNRSQSNVCTSSKAFGRHEPSKLAGFTLVELLVVIGIIALLISILLPALSKARQSALKAACLSNQKQVLLAILMYAGDNQGILPGPAVPVCADHVVEWDRQLLRSSRAFKHDACAKIPRGG